MAYPEKRQVTEKRLAANRAAARKSTGPRTAQGKQRSAFNSFQHGGFTRHEHLWRQALERSGDDPHALDRLRQPLLADWQPATAQQQLLIDDLAWLYWLRDRTRLAFLQLQARRLPQAQLDRDRRRFEARHRAPPPPPPHCPPPRPPPPPPPPSPPATAPPTAASPYPPPSINSAPSANSSTTSTTTPPAPNGLTATKAAPIPKASSASSTVKILPPPGAASSTTSGSSASKPPPQPMTPRPPKSSPSSPQNARPSTKKRRSSSASSRWNSTRRTIPWIR